MTSSTGCIGPKENIFNPTWPVNCPWVLSVGATKVYPGHSVTGPDPESAVLDYPGHPYSVEFSSGGGFSNVYAPAKYQRAAIDTYFKEHNPPYPSYSELTDNNTSIGYSGASANGGIYNRIGRVSYADWLDELRLHDARAFPMSLPLGTTSLCTMGARQLSRGALLLPRPSLLPSSTESTTSAWPSARSLLVSSTRCCTSIPRSLETLPTVRPSAILRHFNRKLTKRVRNEPRVLDARVLGGKGLGPSHRPGNATVPQVARAIPRTAMRRIGHIKRPLYLDPLGLDMVGDYGVAPVSKEDRLSPVRCGGL